MDRKKRKALEEDGWKFGTVQDLLELSDEEAALIEVKVALASALKKRRCKKRLTQAQLAARIGSDQSRIAKMERGDSTIDLLMKSLISLGASKKEIGRQIASAA